MADTGWVEYEPPSKYTKLAEPGDTIRGVVKKISAGKYGPEVTFLLETGTETVMSCSPAQLQAWAENAAEGEAWEIAFVGAAPEKDGKSGAKKFKFFRRVNKDGVPF